MGISPAQRFLGRQCKTKLPMSKALLHPRYPIEEDQSALHVQKVKQAHYYNRHVKPLQPLHPEETVRMQLPGESTWTAGTCVWTAGPRSYDIVVGSQHYRRNHRQILRTNEAPLE